MAIFKFTISHSRIELWQFLLQMWNYRPILSTFKRLAFINFNTNFGICVYLWKDTSGLFFVLNFSHITKQKFKKIKKISIGQQNRRISKRKLRKLLAVSGWLGATVSPLDKKNSTFITKVQLS